MAKVYFCSKITYSKLTVPNYQKCKQTGKKLNFCTKSGILPQCDMSRIVREDIGEKKTLQTQRRILIEEQNVNLVGVEQDLEFGRKFLDFIIWLYVSKLLI